MSSGGYVAGPSDAEPMPTDVKLIREIEPGLAIVSIDGGAPEFLISAEWVRTHDFGQAALEELNRKYLAGGGE